jgi:uncharacterized membrane protein YqiK
VESDWLTYEQAAERLGTTAEGVRQRAIRKRWPRQIGNDGLARLRPPDGWPNPGRTQAERANKRPVRTQAEPRPDASTTNALLAHIETLKEQLAAQTARSEKLVAELAERDAQHAAKLAAEVAEERAKAQVEIDGLKALAAEMRARADAAEARGEKAVSALAALAEPLQALAAERARPWWKRLVS